MELGEKKVTPRFQWCTPNARVKLRNDIILRSSTVILIIGICAKKNTRKINKIQLYFTLGDSCCWVAGEFWILWHHHCWKLCLANNLFSFSVFVIVFMFFFLHLFVCVKCKQTPISDFIGMQWVQLNFFYLV